MSTEYYVNADYFIFPRWPSCCKTCRWFLPILPESSRSSYSNNTFLKCPASNIILTKLDGYNKQERKVLTYTYRGDQVSLENSLLELKLFMNFRSRQECSQLTTDSSIDFMVSTIRKMLCFLSYPYRYRQLLQGIVPQNLTYLLFLRDYFISLIEERLLISPFSYLGPFLLYLRGKSIIFFAGLIIGDVSLRLRDDSLCSIITKLLDLSSFYRQFIAQLFNNFTGVSKGT